MSINYPNRAVPRLDLGVAWMEYVYSDALYPEFIATDVFPIFRSPVQAAKFAALAREAFLSAADTTRAPRSGYNRVDGGAKDKAFSCQEHGLEGVADDRERNIFKNQFDLEVATLRLIARKIMVGREIRVAAKVIDPATFTGASLATDVSADPWDNAGSPVIDPVIAAKEHVRFNCGMTANALILSRSRLENLLTNTQIKGHFPGAPLVTLEMIRQAMGGIFGLQRLLVGSAILNTADEGQAYVGAEVWSGDYAMVAHVCEGSADSLIEPGLGRTILFAPETPEELLVESYREEQSRGDVLRCRQDVDELLLDPNFGHLLKIR